MTLKEIVLIACENFQSVSIDKTDKYIEKVVTRIYSLISSEQKPRMTEEMARTLSVAILKTIDIGINWQDIQRMYDETIVTKFGK